jgi:hypothetical protein
MRKTTIWLTPGQDLLLRRLSWEHRRSRSDLIREGIRLVAEALGAVEPPPSRRSRQKDDDWFNDQEQQVIWMKNAHWDVPRMAGELHVAEADVLDLLRSVGEKMDRLSRPSEPRSRARPLDPLSLGP